MVSGARSADCVILDAFFPADGQSLVDLQPAPLREAITKAGRDGATPLPPLQLTEMLVQLA
jgi:hypothetical protein